MVLSVCLTRLSLVLRRRNSSPTHRTHSHVHASDEGTTTYTIEYAK